MVKTYFWLSKETVVSENSDHYTFNFPPEFIASRNAKHIVIEECKATFKSQLVGDVIMHADFIHRDHYLDHACCFVNEDRRDLAKYEYDSSTKQTFRIWFTDLHGDIVDIDAFVVRALLITA
jgi:hypothetical protein